MKTLIDTHIHTGLFQGMHGMVDMSREKVLEHMNVSGTTHSIISTTMCAEYFGEGIVEDKFTQVQHNLNMFNEFKNDENIKFLFWIKANTEKFSNEVADFILANKDRFLGLKVHPFHSNMKIDDERLLPYMEFANSEKLPVAFHTVPGDGVDTKSLGELAKKFTNTNFIAVHMDMTSDNINSAKQIATVENLYGDTTWVSYENFLKVIEIAPKEKILFGTDAPISDDMMSFYGKYYENYEEHKIIFKDNPEKVFNLR